MKEYSSGLSKDYILAAILAIIVCGGILAASYIGHIPGNGNHTTTTTTTPTATPTTTTFPTTTTTTIPTPTTGAKIASYLRTMESHIMFYWTANCTFTMQNLTNYYKQFDPGAFVLSVYIEQLETQTNMTLHFSPYDAGIRSYGSITLEEWDSLSIALIEDGIAQMEESNRSKDYNIWLPDFFIDVFFDDDTFIHVAYFQADSLVFVLNGTWTGSLSEWGYPQITGEDIPVWLEEDGYLQTHIWSLYETITTTVSAPWT